MNSTPFSVRLTLWIWLLAALALGNSLGLQKLPPGVLPGGVIVLTVLVLLACAKISSVRTWIEQLDLRVLVAFHLTRFVGIYFLILYQRGILPGNFAISAGWGDIAVATLALAVCFLPLPPATRKRAIGIWNIIGLVDILLVLLTATRLGLQDNLQMRPLTYLPLSLLPTFLVPLIIATHILIYQRLNRASAQP